MIYNFFNGNTAGPLMDYFNGVITFNKHEEVIYHVKLIDYTILEYHTLDKREVDVKKFTFGYEGNTFKLYLSKSDTLCVTSDDNMPYTGQFHGLRVYYMGGTSSNNKKMIEMKAYLIAFIRDNKLKQLV